MEVQGHKWMEKGPWYNKTICLQLNSHSFKVVFVSKDRYELMCAGNTYVKEHINMPGGGSCGYGRPIPSNSYKEALI